MNNFNEKTKKEIILEIDKDFANAVKGIDKLPKNSKFAVYIAYRYYNKLLKKLKHTPLKILLKKELEFIISTKFIVIARSYVKYQLNLIQWI